MGLKLMLEQGDKVMAEEAGLMVDVLFIGEKKVQLQFTAPKSLKIAAVYKDSAKMFKNMKREAAAPKKYGKDADV